MAKPFARRSRELPRGVSQAGRKTFVERRVRCCCCDCYGRRH